ncbi:MAG: prolyl oligopeptidase family serine peptidase [Acidimicrobiales bacterium]
MNIRTVSIALAVAALVGTVACAPPPLPLVTTNPPAGATGPSSGCGTTTRGPVSDDPETVVVDGASRRFTLTIPPNHQPGSTTPIPLVLDFHGLIEGLAGTHPFATQFSEKARQQGFAVADPIGGGDGVYWDVSLQEDNPDLHFVDTLVAQLERTMCIDRSRLYVTGLSFGAAMTSMLMCMRSNTFAAAAPVAGIMNLCTATSRNVPVVTFHGTADPILLFDGYVNTPQTIATKYGCDMPPTVTTHQPSPDPATGGPITLTSWNCHGVKDAVEFYRIDGGGHSWPGSAFFGLIGFIVGPTATSLDATSVIWDFFARHHLPASSPVS